MEKKKKWMIFGGTAVVVVGVFLCIAALFLYKGVTLFFDREIDVLYRYIKVKRRLIADDIILCDMEQVRKMLDEVNDGAVAHHHTLGHAGGAGASLD